VTELQVIPPTEYHLGIITPTAALSSLPFTPVNLKLHYLYDEKKAEYAGIAGPYDAFSPSL
jgi:hypothetical protein